MLTACRRPSRPIPRKNRSAWTRRWSRIRRRFRLKARRHERQRSQRRQESCGLLQQSGRRLRQGWQRSTTPSRPTNRPRKSIPRLAAQYLFQHRRGAHQCRQGRTMAIVAFDKCIAADPNRADAYYQKGVNLIGKATLQGDKMVAPPGTAEAFQKYLELRPPGHTPDVPSRCWPASEHRSKPASARRSRHRRSSYFPDLRRSLLKRIRGGPKRPPFCAHFGALRRYQGLCTCCPYARLAGSGRVSHLPFFPFCGACDSDV